MLPLATKDLTVALKTPAPFSSPQNDNDDIRTEKICPIAAAGSKKLAVQD
jgi:hypothetical protein